MKKLLLVLIGMVIVNNLYSEELKWEKFGDLKSARNHFQALPINDSTILVMGGYNNHSSEKVLRTCEFINVKSNTVTPAPSMSVSRAEFVALLTKDSNVIVFGGINSSYQGENSVELYDRKTNTWKRLSNMLQRRIQHAAAFISNTEILIICGRETSSSDGSNRCEIYDYVAQKSTYTGDYPQGGCSGSLAISKNGDALGFGFRLGAPDSYRSENIYKYDKSTKSWKVLAKMNDKVQNIPFCKLLDGRIVISNGSISEYGRNYSNQVLIEENNVFASKVTSKVPTEWHSLIRFRDNSIIKVGGLNRNGRNEASTEIFDFNNNTVSSGPKLITDRAVACVAHMDNYSNNGLGAILVIAGCNSGYSNSLTSIEILKYAKASNIEIESKTDDCLNSQIIINSNFNIVNINKILTDNVDFTCNNLPTSKPNISLSLIDKNKNGYYILEVVDSDGKTFVIKDSIITKYNTTKFESNIFFDNKLNFGYCEVNKTKCTDLVLKNDKSFPIVIDHIELLKNSQYVYSYPQITLPLTLFPNQTQTIKICFTPNKNEQFVDTLIVRDDCNEYKIPMINSTIEPVITKTDISNECGVFTFEIESISKINSIVLNSNSNNVGLSFTPNLPNTKIRVSVFLLNSNINGYYDITILNESSLMNTFQGALLSSGISLEIVSPLDSLGFFNVEKTGLSKIKPDTIKLKNNGFTDILIDSIYIYYNVMFSVPQSQIPLLVKAGETVELQVYYMPFKLGEAKDSIRFFGRCLDFLIRLKSEGIPNHYSNETKCGSVVTLSSYKLNTILQGPYPNPTDNSFSIILSKRIAENDLVLVDFYGNQAEMKIQTCTTYDENYKLYNILIGNVNSGNYFLTDRNRTFYSIINKSN